MTTAEKPGPQAVEIGLPWEKHNLDRHSLNNLREVARRIIRRQKCKLGTAGGRQLIDLAVKHSIRKRIDPNVCRIANSHVGQLSLFKIGLNPNVALYEIDHLRTWSDQLTGKNMTLSNRSIGWSCNAGVGQIDLCDDDRGFLRLDISFVNIVLCVERLSLALGSLKLTLTCGEGALGAREVRFARRQAGR